MDIFEVLFISLCCGGVIGVAAVIAIVISVPIDAIEDSSNSPSYNAPSLGPMTEEDVERLK